MSDFNSTSNRLSNQKRLDEVFPLRKIIIFVFILAVCCVYLPCAVFSVGYIQTPWHFSLLAYFIIGASIAFLFVIIKRLLFSISCTVIIVSLYYFTFSPVPSAILAAIVLIFAIGAYLSSICTKKLYPLFLLLPAVCYIGGLALTGDPAVSLLSVVPLVASIVQGRLQRKNTERKTIILASSITFLALLSGAAALFLYLNGKLSYTVIQTNISIDRKSVV